MNSQTISWVSFSAGLTGFLALATEMLKEHNTWAFFYATPLGAIHFMVLGGFFVAMIGGAIGAQVPRSPDKNYGQRKEDIQQPPGQPEGTTRTVAIITKPIEPIPDKETK
jgi:hypothetical protein